MARDLVLEIVEQVRGNALSQAAGDLDKVAGSTDKAAGAAKDYTGELKSLDTQITSTKLKIQQLGAEFVSTKDKATGKELRGERSLLAQLEKIRKELEQATPGLAESAAAAGANAGGGFLSGFFDTVGSLPAKLRGTALIAATVAVAAASPIIGASIAGAVVGAVGAGGLAGGIGAASRDAGVRAAASDFGKAVSDEFFAGGDSFVEPVKESLDILKQGFADLDLGSSWERIAPFVTRVADGIAGLGREFMPGFNRALDVAGPGLAVLGAKLPEIGAALGDMTATIAESEGSLEGLIFILDATASALEFAGDFVGFFSDRFDDLLKVSAGLSGVLEDLPVPELQRLFGMPGFAEWNDKWEDMLNVSQGAFTNLEGITRLGTRVTAGLYEQGDAAHALAAAVREMHEEYSEYLGIQMSVDDANRRVSQGLLDLNKALKENGKDWRDTTEAGLANRAALSAQVDALIRQRQANIDAGMSATDATTKFQAELEALAKLAEKAGISKAALQDLVGDYYIKMHVGVDTGADTYNRALANAIAGRSRISGFQHGGDPPMGEPFWVGEGGRPELMVLSPRPHVFSHQESRAMVSQSKASANETAQALAVITEMLKELKARPPTVINVNAPEGTSPRELSAMVSREQAWTR